MIPARAIPLALVAALALALLPARARSAGAGGGDADSAAARPGAAEAAAPTVSHADSLRYARVAKQLVEALVSGDAKRYRALHSDSGWKSAIDWWQEMFPNQRRRFGAFTRAWGPAWGTLRVGNTGYRGVENGAIVLIHFEKSAGAALSFRLDDEDRISGTAVMVLGEFGAPPADDLPVLRPAAGGVRR